MIEYLHNAIRAMAGADIRVDARVTDEEGAIITTGVKLILHDKKDAMIESFEGSYENDSWHFLIPAQVTKGLKGRYFYCIQYNGNPLCFKEPLYLI